MTTEHTRGPWAVAPNSNAGTRGCTVWADDGLVKVAECNSPNLPLAQRRADARLIAAAPDLLDDLQWAVSLIQENAQRIGYVQGSPTHKRLLKAASTIAKAQGEA